MATGKKTMKCVDLSNDTCIIFTDDQKVHKPYFGRRRYNVIIAPSVIHEKFLMTRIKGMLRDGGTLIVVDDEVK